VGAQPGRHDQPGAAGSVQDLPFALDIKDPRPAHCHPRVGTVDFGVLDDRLPNASSEGHRKCRTRADGLGRQHLHLQHLGIPPWLIPYVHYEVK